LIVHFLRRITPGPAQFVMPSTGATVMKSSILLFLLTSVAGLVAIGATQADTVSPANAGEIGKPAVSGDHPGNGHHGASHSRPAGRFSQQEIAAGRLFMMENAKKDGVVSLPGGLQYRVLKRGNGDSPKSDDAVLIDYSGWLADGQSLGRSAQGGKLGPVRYRLKNLIPGLKEALLRMKEGDRWQVFVPPHLSFSRGSSALEQRVVIYEVALLETGP
jgi:hypothetical protein